MDLVGLTAGTIGLRVLPAEDLTLAPSTLRGVGTTPGGVLAITTTPQLRPETA